MLVNSPISRYRANAISPASRPMPPARNETSTMRNCAGGTTMLGADAPAPREFRELPSPLLASASAMPRPCFPRCLCLGLGLCFFSGGRFPGRLFRGRSGESCARVFVHLHDALQGSDQNRPLQAKFFPVLDRESPQHLLTFRSQGHEPLPPILGPRESAHISAPGQPVHQVDGAVVLDLQAFREFSDP